MTHIINIGLVLYSLLYVIIAIVVTSFLTNIAILTAIYIRKLLKMPESDFLNDVIKDFPIKPK